MQNGGSNYGVGGGSVSTPGVMFYQYLDRISTAGNPQYSGDSSSGYTAKTEDQGNGVVSGPSDAPLYNLNWGQLNDMAKSWIKKYAQALAKELSIPVIALSQLSRAVETRGSSKRPLLSDLRESGAIEQDADIVSFIYRPEYYKIDEWDDEERTPSAGQAEFIVAKHRNGGLNNIKLKFVSNLGKFENLDNFETPFEYQSKINKDSLKVNPDQAFESGGYREDNEDIPF